MPIRYALSPKTIVLCDFDKGGFRSPEMVKRRPAIVLVGRLPRRDNLHTVVPLSGTASHPDCVYHCQIELAVHRRSVRAARLVGKGRYGRHRQL